MQIAGRIRTGLRGTNGPARTLTVTRISSSRPSWHQGWVAKTRDFSGAEGPPKRINFGKLMRSEADPVSPAELSQCSVHGSVRPHKFTSEAHGETYILTRARVKTGWVKQDRERVQSIPQKTRTRVPADMTRLNQARCSRLELQSLQLLTCTVILGSRDLLIRGLWVRVPRGPQPGR